MLAQDLQDLSNQLPVSDDKASSDFSQTPTNRNKKNDSRLNRCIDKVKSEYKVEVEAPLTYYSNVAVPVEMFMFTPF